MSDAFPTAFADIRIVEIGNQNGEFAAKMMAMNGAQVVRIEPPGGLESRKIGPFYQGGLAEEHGDLERSLFHWHYNLGKKGVTLDIGQSEGKRLFLELVKDADVLIESHDPGYLRGLGLGYDDLSALNPGLIYLSLTEFGQDGPWSGYQGSDLVHLALGGEMMMCGYDMNEDGVFDTPPMAGQMWQSRHVVGNLAFMDVMAAIMYRDRTGEGQHIKLSLHEACANATEWSLPWYLAGGPVPPRRITIPLLQAADGEYIVTHTPTFPGEWDKQVEFLAEYGAEGDLRDPQWQDEGNQRSPEGRAHLAEVTAKFIADRNSEEVWVEAQKHDVIWVAVRSPQGNIESEHFRVRGIVGEVEHPDLGRSFFYPTAPRAQGDLPWLSGPRAPHLGEHNAEVFGAYGLDDAQLADLKAKGVI